MLSVILFLLTDKINQASMLYLFYSGYLSIEFVQYCQKNQNKLTLGGGSIYFQFPSMSFGFGLIRVLSDSDRRMVYDSQDGL